MGARRGETLVDTDEEAWLPHMPPSWELHTSEDIEDAFTHFPYDPYPEGEAECLARDIGAMLPVTVIDPMYPAHAEAAAQVLLGQLALQALDYPLLALPSFTLAHVFASHGLTLSYDPHCAADPRLGLQPGFWQARSEDRPLTLSLAYAPGHVADLLLPLARRFTLQVVCLLVPPVYLQDAHEWRQAMLGRLRDHGVLHLCPVWDSDHLLMGIWLVAFADVPTRTRMLRPGFALYSNIEEMCAAATPYSSPSY